MWKSTSPPAISARTTHPAAAGGCGCAGAAQRVTFPTARVINGGRITQAVDGDGSRYRQGERKRAGLVAETGEHTTATPPGPGTC